MFFLKPQLCLCFCYFRCGFCKHTFLSNLLLHLHKEDTDHWSDDGYEEVTHSEDTESEDDKENEQTEERNNFI